MLRGYAKLHWRECSLDHIAPKCAGPRQEQKPCCACCECGQQQGKGSSLPRVPWLAVPLELALLLALSVRVAQRSAQLRL